MSTWNLDKVEQEIQKAFDNDSEVELLEILKMNSFLFHDLYARKFGIQPCFAELQFGGKYRCDFAWLNDDSIGPEWVLVEVEKPKLKLFTQKNEPTAVLNHATEQIKSWDRYFKENPLEKKRIFGAVARFRYILVGGLREDWQTEHGIKWRNYQTQEYKIEIRSIDVFKNAIQVARNRFSDLWSFEENPVCLKHSQLENYWQEYKYMDTFRKTL